jgi:flagellar hook-length control protein FliK
MIDAVQYSIPQPVSVEASVNPGSKADSAGFSFTDALGAVVDSGKAAEAPAEVDAQPTKADDPSVALMGLAGAGAVQVAAALPLPVGPTISVPDQGVAADVPGQSPAPTAVVGVDQPSIEALGVGQGFGNPSPVGPNPSPVGPNPNAAAASEPEMAAVGVQSAQVGGASVQPSSDNAPDQHVVLGQFEPVAKPVGTTSGSQVVSQLASEAMPQAGSALQANPAVEQGAAVAGDDVPADDQTGKPRRSEKAAVTEASVATPTRVPVEAEAVTVQWQFDGSSRAPRAVTVQPTAQMPIGSDSGSEAKPSGGETHSSTGQQSPDPQAAAMGVQFSSQLREAAQQTAPATSAPDLHVRVIDQVVRQVSLQQIDGRSNLVVKLNPPDLGALRLQITQDATGMTTHIQAANSQVRGLLEAHMPLLMDSLAKAGVRMDSVSVSVGTSFNAFAQNARQQDAQPNSYQSRQMLATGRETGGVQTIADAAMRPTWGSTRQAGYSWLA